MAEEAECETAETGEEGRAGESVSWGTLPEHIVASVLSLLGPASAGCRASAVCGGWRAAFRSSLYWRRCQLRLLLGPADEAQVAFAEPFAPFFVRLTLDVDQGRPESRLLATRLIGRLAQLPRRHIRQLRLRFVGEKPLFYAGQDFADALAQFHSAPLGKGRPLEHLSMSGLPIGVTDVFLGSLGQHWASLRSVDVQNEELVCRLSPTALGQLTANAPMLEDLRCFYASLEPFVLAPLAAARRRPLLHLSFVCRRQEKYRQEWLGDAVWASLAAASPRLRLTAKFDHTFHTRLLRHILQPSMPLQNLFLETYDIVHEEVELVSRLFGASLEKVVLQTPAGPELAGAVEALARRATRLASLHVMCLLPPHTVERVRELCPAVLRHPERFTLHSPPAPPFPWATAHVLDEIRPFWSQ